MKELKADEISFICILYACSHSGLLDEVEGVSNL